jgi:GTPase Era involved in 16S rRNA processing
VVLKSTKDQILGVDTPGQHVPPRVLYRTTCLQIRNTAGSVFCSVVWGMASYFVKRLTHMVQEVPLMGNL